MGISNETIHCPDYNDAVSSCPQGLFHHETLEICKKNEILLEKNI